MENHINNIAAFLLGFLGGGALSVLMYAKYLTLKARFKRYADWLARLDAFVNDIHGKNGCKGRIMTRGNGGRMASVPMPRWWPAFRYWRVEDLNNG